MTRKEKIYAQIIDVKNEERVILGLTPTDKERNLANGFAHNHTIIELEEDLAIAQQSLAATKHKAKVDAFFATEAGAEYKAEGCRMRMENTIVLPYRIYITNV